MPWTYMSDGLHVPQTISHLLGKPHSCPSVASKPWSWVHWNHLPRSLVFHLLIPKLYFSLPLRRLLEESTGLLEEEGGRQPEVQRKEIGQSEAISCCWLASVKSSSGLLRKAVVMDGRGGRISWVRAYLTY